MKFFIYVNTNLEFYNYVHVREPKGTYLLLWL